MLRSLLLVAFLGVGSACTTVGNGATRTIALDAPFRLVVGEEVVLPNGGTLRYVGVREDSRCRPAVQCIRAGDAKVDFDITTLESDSQRLTILMPDQAAARSGNLQVAIQALDFSAPPRVDLMVTTR